MTAKLSRFEATLNLACAAMTVLLCGNVVDQELLSGSRRRRQIVPLREEFPEFFEAHCHFAKILGPVVCPELNGPDHPASYYDCGPRLRFLLRVRVHPDEIARALKSAGIERSRRLTAPETSKIARELGVDSYEVSFCQKARREDVDLGKRWNALRKELARQCERIGGAQ